MAASSVEDLAEGYCAWIWISRFWYLDANHANKRSYVLMYITVSTYNTENLHLFILYDAKCNFFLLFCITPYKYDRK